MPPVFTRTGGALVNGLNFSSPMAEFFGDAECLTVSVLFQNYRFPKSSIRRISRHRGLFSVGLRIVHTRFSFPEQVVFWTSRSGFKELVTELRSLGYQVDF